MNENLIFAENLRQKLVAAGWDQTSVNLHISIEPGETRVSSLSIYPAASQPGDENLTLPSEWIYSSAFEDRDWLERKAAEILERVGTPKSAKTKEFLESVSKITAMAEDLGLSADFINPLTAMAEQLRTNILPKP